MSDLTTADIADSLGTTPRALRKFLRSSASPYEPVGQGSRYHIGSEDLVELKELFETWVGRPGSRTASPASSSPRAPRKPRPKIVEKPDPLADDGDLMYRLTHTVAERQRRAGVICDYEWHHPKVKGLDVKCTNKPMTGSRQCPMHQQLFFCGDVDTPVDNYCGPGGRHPKPFCKWHNADINQAQLDEYLELPIEQRDY